MGDEPLDDMTESMHGAMSLDGDTDKLRVFYDEWADDYDDDVGSHGYGMPDMVVHTLAACGEKLGWTTERHDVAVIDAGCGTGLVGVALHRDGWTHLRGVDLSEEMAAKATARGVYRSVEGGVDLTSPTADHLRGTADAVTVGGVFTVGHVPPDALEPMASLARDGGVLAVSTRDAYQRDTNWHDVVAGLEASGRLERLVHTPEGPYTMDSTGDYWGWRVRH